MTGEERRKWARIEASLECTVASADQTFEAKVVNVSRSGIALMAPAGQLKAGETASVMLEKAPSPQGREGVPERASDDTVALAVSGEVVRIVENGDETVYGIHFEALPPDTEEQIVALLKSLAAGKGGGRRAHPRVSTRIKVTCKSRERFDAWLNDLSKGGFSVRCPGPIAEGATLTVEFGIGAHPGLISIEGVVRHVEELPGRVHVAGLSFTPPTPEQQQKVHDLLDLLIGLD